MTKEWIYRLNKVEITHELEVFGTEGTTYAAVFRISSQHPEMFLVSRAEPTLSSMPPPVPKISIEASTPSPIPELTGQTIDQMRKWGCHFDREAFLERIEKLSEGILRGAITAGTSGVIKRGGSLVVPE